MGNSNGTLAEYWDAIESTPGLQGGFIWEFWDHGLVQTLPDGRTRWAYGGDFGDAAQRRQLRVRRDGLAGPPARSPRCGSTSASPRPSASAARGRGRRGRIDVANHQHFTRSRLAPGALQPDRRRGRGRRRRRSTCRDRRPASARRSPCPAGSRPIPTTGEAFLTVRVTTAEEQAWAPAGLRGLRPAAPGRAAGRARPSAPADRR